MAPNLPSNTAAEILTASAPSSRISPEELVTQLRHEANHKERPRKVPATRKSELEEDPPYKVEPVWFNIMAFVLLHGSALWGLILVFTGQVMFYTTIWALLMASLGAMGITAGAHRLWSHRSYKAKWPLRLFLAACQTLAFQNSIYEWCRDHRVHHKFSETNADPHNASRGFFFSHIGWLMCKKHPDVKRKGATVDMSDLEADPIVMWQKKHYLILMPIMCFIGPMAVPMLFWGESYHNSLFVAGIMRYVMSLNCTWLVNSAAHIWGTKPYEKGISPTENLGVAIAAYGEGWHNYHHVFPWDYKAAELGNYRANLSTAFIDFMAWIGMAYDLKSVPVDLVRRRALRTGDGSHKPQKSQQSDASTKDESTKDVKKNEEKSKHDQHHHIHLMEGETPIWGWGDKDMHAEDAQLAVRDFRSR